jgi:hypothetical protein
MAILMTPIKLRIEDILLKPPFHHSTIPLFHDGMKLNHQIILDILKR